MKRERVLLCLGVVMALAVAVPIFEGIADAQQYNLSRYFPLDEGITWTFLGTRTDSPKTIQVYCVAKIRDASQNVAYRRFLFNSGESEPDYSYNDMKWTKKGLEVYKSGESDGGYSLFDPPLLRYPSSMSIGDTFEQTITATDYDSSGTQTGTRTVIWQITLEAVEDVQVLAGNFANCLKVSMVTTSEEEIEHFSHWLAFGLGQVKGTQVETGGLVRLLSLTKDGKTYSPTP